MAQRVSKNTKSKKSTATIAPPSNDNVLWMTGFILVVVGLISAASVLSHFIHWSSDLSALRNNPEFSGEVIPFENICSKLGATLAYWMVDCSFGVFGIIIPVVLTVLGWRVFRKKSLHINHFALSAALLLVMGSLTLGLVAKQMSLPYDIGGELGQACAADLTDVIGVFGTVLILITGWVLTGVFINRNFRRIVDGIGDGVEKQGDRMKRVVEDVITARAKTRTDEENEESDVESQQSAVNSVPQQESVPEPEPTPQPAYQPTPQPVVNMTPPVATAPTQASQEHSVAQPQQEGEKVVRMNEYLAAQIEQQKPSRDFGRVVEDDEFYIEGEQMPEQVMPTEQVMDMSSYDDDGFVVEPNGGAKPEQIDVSQLLAREEQARQARELDEQGFAVVEREVEQMYGAEADAVPTDDAMPYKADAESYVDLATVPEPRLNVAPRSPLAERGLPETDDIVVTVRENAVRRVAESDIDTELYDPLRDLEGYKKPYVSLLEDYKSPHKVSDAEIYDNKCRIQETLKYFGIPIVDIQATVGPTVTLYEIVQAQGVKISKVQGLEKDIAQSLRAQGIRIIAPIPGRGTIGIEVPNRDKQIVSMYSAICSEEFQHAKMELPVVIGRTIQNTNFTFDLAKMPHLLVAGATGQGKSVGLNAIITSLLYRKHPAELKFVMIDPKMVEFSVYNKLERHFLAKMESEDEAIVTDPKKAVYALNSLVEEMGRRLELCKMATARNIVEYNEKFTARRLNPNKGHRFLPYIVVIVDEFADLIMTAKEVEVPVMRLAQKARAVGIHLIIATQRPDVRVITGGIKANFPSRIAFRVIQMIDSRTIIDQPGANQLIGRGDMLFSKDGELTRVQCALVETKEVERLVDYIAKQQGYTEAYALPDYTPEAGSETAGGFSDGESGAPVKYDSLFGEVARAAVTTGVISTSSIQRNYEVGFNRAGRIMMQLERAGIVGPQVGAKPREIKFYDLPSLEAKLQELGVF
ncbi:MAG: DNA translocase FtsK 4TM domain-containing protein [Alistipes sp.]|nr:DNA translocase FtsK 4TM domain-containing protein [Alistipes sp.]